MQVQWMVLAGMALLNGILFLIVIMTRSKSRNYMSRTDVQALVKKALDEAMSTLELDRIKWNVEDLRRNSSSKALEGMFATHTDVRELEDQLNAFLAKVPEITTLKEIDQQIEKAKNDFRAEIDIMLRTVIDIFKKELEGGAHEATDEMEMRLNDKISKIIKSVPPPSPSRDTKREKYIEDTLRGIALYLRVLSRTLVAPLSEPISLEIKMIEDRRIGERDRITREYELAAEKVRDAEAIFQMTTPIDLPEVFTPEVGKKYVHSLGLGDDFLELKKAYDGIKEGYAAKRDELIKKTQRAKEGLEKAKNNMLRASSAKSAFDRNIRESPDEARLAELRKKLASLLRLESDLQEIEKKLGTEAVPTPKSSSTTKPPSLPVPRKRSGNGHSEVKIPEIPPPRPPSDFKN